MIKTPFANSVIIHRPDVTPAMFEVAEQNPDLWRLRSSITIRVRESPDTAEIAESVDGEIRTPQIDSAIRSTLDALMAVTEEPAAAARTPFREYMFAGERHRLCWIIIEGFSRSINQTVWSGVEIETIWSEWDAHQRLACLNMRVDEVKHRNSKPRSAE